MYLISYYLVTQTLMTIGYGDNPPVSEREVIIIIKVYYNSSHDDICYNCKHDCNWINC